MLNIVIIEDELNLLVTLDEVKNSVEWFRLNDKKYDLVFMDIRLSDGLSFDILEQVNISSPIIFVTAYDDYAIQAFKTNGIGYVLKPFDKEDLRGAIEKFKSLRSATVKDFITPELLHLSGQLKMAYKGYRQSFLFHFRDKLIPVASKDIAWFYTINEVSYACNMEGTKFITEFTLEQLQQQLDPEIFFRANRQFILQRKSITEIEFFFNSRLLIKTTPKTDENILVSKARVPEFKAWMNA